MGQVDGDTSLDESSRTAQDAPVAEPGGALVTIPGAPRQQLPPTGAERSGGSFWQRIGMPGRQNRSKAEQQEVLLSRLSDLERRLSESQSAIESRITKLDRRLNEVWEVEEQLSYLLEIQHILRALQDHQCDLADKVHSNRRALNLLGVALVVASIAILTMALEPWGAFLLP